MVTGKCHQCGYYFNGAVLSSCPRCSQGFTRFIDEHFIQGQSGELGKGIQSKGLMITSGIVAAGLVIAVVAITHHSSGSSSYTDYSSSDQTTSDNTAVDTASWIPSGFQPFDINSDIARNADYQMNGCDNTNPNGSISYCWVLQIATKHDCQVVSATLDLTNDGSNVGQITGEVDNTYSGSPVLIEIDSFDNPDVNDTTEATVTNISCDSGTSQTNIENPAPASTDATGDIGNNSTTDSNPTDATGSIGN